MLHQHSCLPCAGHLLDNRLDAYGSCLALHIGVLFGVQELGGQLLDHELQRGFVHTADQDAQAAGHSAEL